MCRLLGMLRRVWSRLKLADALISRVEWPRQDPNDVNGGDDQGRLMASLDRMALALHRLHLHRHELHFVASRLWDHFGSAGHVCWASLEEQVASSSGTSSGGDVEGALRGGVLRGGRATRGRDAGCGARRGARW